MILIPFKCARESYHHWRYKCWAIIKQWANNDTRTWIFLLSLSIHNSLTHLSREPLSQMDYHWLAHSSLLCHGCMCAHTRVHANMSTAQIFMHLCAYLGILMCMPWHIWYLMISHSVTTCRWMCIPWHIWHPLTSSGVCMIQIWNINTCAALWSEVAPTKPEKQP